jgi:hypothetical protein
LVSVPELASSEAMIEPWTSGMVVARVEPVMLI